MEDTTQTGETIASVGVQKPLSAASELAGLKEVAGGDSVLTIALALIAVLGGSAGWKFWNNRAKLKHEEKIKQMELEAELAKRKVSSKKKKTTKANKKPQS
jgi:hypothetical protein